jgi:organic hydroperoxide reductase OsmC/OhrA
MSRTATYSTMVHWKGEHLGYIRMGNGPEMDFSAPPDAHGHAGVLTPEDAFVAAVNTCVMMMFLWSAERFKLELVNYECSAEGTKLIELDRTEIFTQVLLRPRIVVRADAAGREGVLKRLQRALDSAVKYSLIANSIKSKLVIESEIETVP